MHENELFDKGVMLQKKTAEAAASRLSNAVDAVEIPDVPLNAKVCVDTAACFRVKLKQTCCDLRHTD